MRASCAPLANLNITTINLNSTVVNQTVNGNIIAEVPQGCDRPVTFDRANRQKHDRSACSRLLRLDLRHQRKERLRHLTLRVFERLGWLPARHRKS